MPRLNHLQTLVRSLNPTPLRTSNSAQLSSALENIINRTFPSSTNIASGSGEERAVEGMVKSLERLRAGQAMMDYPLSQRTLRPRHDPHYYERIMDGIHNSAKGQGRSWWRSFFQLKGRA